MKSDVRNAELRSIKGRGSADNPRNRFESRQHLAGLQEPEPDSRSPLTEFIPDRSKSIIACNQSPDVPFQATINPYRGCEHGCIYCYARPTHEYLGFSAGLDFETKIMVKEQASELLRAALQSPKWTPQVLGLSGVTDPYQPIERDKKLTRHCLEVVAEFRNPVLVITKNALVTRDIDLFTELAAYGAAAVFVSVTTLDTQLARVMEPRTATPKRRLTAIRALSQAGIPVGVLIAPVIPGLNDHEIPEIIAQSVDSGAQFAGYVSLRLPHAVAGLFENWLTLHFPNRASKVLSQVRQLHGGKLCGTNFGSRMKGKGVIADHISALFQMSVNRAGIGHWHPKLSTSSFRRPGETQMSLFG